MNIKDSFGYSLSGAERSAAQHFDKAVGELRCYIDDPVATIDQALAASPQFVMGHLFKAYLHLLGTEPSGFAVARDCLAAAQRLPANERERGHLAAVAALTASRWHEASRALEDVAIAFPHDGLALQIGHQIDFFTGNARLLRDRIARALPAWDKAMPGYHALLGMYAFGLEECGDYAQAEALGRRGVELEPRDSWSQHAVAHVLEMQGRQQDGIAWMTTSPQAWAKNNSLAVHNWWHLALYHLDLGEIDKVLALYDGPINGQGSSLALEMIDASAMLWRLHLRGEALGDRWQALADHWQKLASGGNYAFNDVHAVMAFVGAGRPAAIAEVMAAQDEAMARADDNAAFTREVGRPAAAAMAAFGDGDYRRTIDLLRPIRTIAHRFGGSHAQRDVLDLTLIEAALRSGESGLARALTAERVALKPTSPLAGILAKRAEAA